MRFRPGTDSLLLSERTGLTRCSGAYRVTATRFLLCGSSKASKFGRSEVTTATKNQSQNSSGQGKIAKKPASARTHGRFRKGQSGNPAGRPRGSRNVTTLAAEALLEGEAVELTKMAIKLAKSGDLVALRLCFNRIIPPRHSRIVAFDFPIIEKVGDILAAHQAVLSAAADGQLTFDEAHQFVGLLEATRRAIETVQLAEELAALKERIGLSK